MTVITDNGEGYGRLSWPCDYAIVKDETIVWFGLNGELHNYPNTGKVVIVLGPTSEFFIKALKRADGNGRIAYHKMMSDRESWANFVPLSVQATRDLNEKGTQEGTTVDA
jgi:hypothetical protein